ncbi:protein phosphatase 1 regulatory subunit 3B-like [Asterias amurensis]|uniref:protein phosphatase 1 regulatory subunit 3B-like n=1 Tax=Asterias amurensis TaxID=7602 RepID=UPI003AB1A09E
MACGLLHTSAMPVDTLFCLGTSPPVPSLLLSQRYTTTSFMYIADKSANCRPSIDQQKLRPCLRGEGQQNMKRKENDTARDCQTTVDSTPKPCEDIGLGDLSISDDNVRDTKQSQGSIGTPFRKSAKKVSFADSKGFALEDVRVMDGPSNVPPVLKSRLLQEIIQDEKPELFHTYTYVVDFEQPAANYLQFRDKLEKNCVCLENVLVKDNTTVMGTAKVKNLSFEKSVSVRFTVNGWESYRDIGATYVQRNQEGQKDRYDSFSFTFDIPQKMKGETIEFCLCYTCKGKSYWDSKGGENYRIISQHEKSLTEQQKMASYYSLSSKSNWTDFSYWKLIDERPYW